ncbi:hypothetical protein K9M42_00640 [Patescibacteria group bacterium]|nr:hypothetical protein [Patescibacteria group bacterium]
MIIVCAHCGKILGEKEPYDNTDITHGYCEKCVLDLYKMVKDKKGNYILTSEIKELS